MILALAVGCGGSGHAVDHKGPPPPGHGPLPYDLTLLVEIVDGGARVRSLSFLPKATISGNVVVVGSDGTRSEEWFEGATVLEQCYGCDPYPGAPPDICSDPCERTPVSEWKLPIPNEVADKLQRTDVGYRVELQDVKFACTGSDCSPPDSIKVVPAFGGVNASCAGGDDADGDFVLSGCDACPDQPEDPDLFQDGDGCPDPDNDKDTILDADDQCPNEPERFNCIRDDDGCPDPAVHFFTENGAYVFEFPEGKGTLDSKLGLLGDVLACQAKGEKKIKLSIRAYAAEAKSKRANLKLSRQRAEFVRQLLIDAGIDPALIVLVEGYGAALPGGVNGNRKALLEVSY